MYGAFEIPDHKKRTIFMFRGIPELTGGMLLERIGVETDTNDAARTRESP